MRKNILQYLINSVLAGIMIGIGGTVFLSLSDKIFGALFFAIGLFIIVTRGFNLYTGKVGYIFDNKPSYLIEVIVTIFGNFIGTFLVGFLLKFTRIYDAISTKAYALCDAKLNDSILSIIILSFFCGLLMYLAVDGYKTGKDIFNKYACVFLGVIVFILCGFEHSIANMYYFAAANYYEIKTFAYLGLMILGNGIGGVFIPLMIKLKGYLEN